MTKKTSKTATPWGSADLVVPPVNSARIAHRIPGAKLVLVPGAPHRLFAENAEAFNREVLAFLTQEPGRSQEVAENSGE